MLRRAALLLCLVPTLVLAEGRDADALIKAIGNTLKAKAYAPGIDFSRWHSIAEKNRARLRAAKGDDEFAAVLNASLAMLGASHVVVLTPEFMKAPFEFRGAGLVTAEDEGGKTVVWKVFPKGAAERAGIRAGDEVIEERNLMSGIDGTPAKRAHVKVRRGRRELEFALDPLPFFGFPRAELDWVDATTAVLAVPTFNVDYDPKLIERLMSEAAPAQRLILDMRYNPGGKPWNVEHLLGFFLPDKSFIGSFVGREESARFSRRHPKGSLTQLAKWAPSKIYVRRNRAPFQGEVVALVNEASGSAAEVAAQALREVAGTPVFGEPTAGAVLMSESETMPGGFELVFPKYDYVSARGNRIEGNPVKPDVPVATTSVGWPGKPDRTLRWIATYLERVARTKAGRENNRASRA